MPTVVGPDVGPGTTLGPTPISTGAGCEGVIGSTCNPVESKED